MVATGLLFVVLLVIGCLIGLLRPQQAEQDAETARRAQVALKEKSERFQRLLEDAREAILLLDSEERILEANRRAEEIYGCGREELLQCSLADLQAPESRQTLYELTSVTETLVFESTHRRRDGSRFPAETRVQTISEGGRTVFQCLVCDITDRKQAEEFQSTRDYLENLLPSSNSPAVVWKADLKIIRFNRAL
jgi:PAS domain S-box-containing protein